MDVLLKLLPLFIPIFVLEIILAVAAVRHPYDRFDSKAFGLVLVLVLLFIGPIPYFVVGRGDEQWMC